MRYAEAGYELHQKFHARREIKNSRRSADGATLPYQHQARRHAPAARVRPVIAPARLDLPDL
jgi:hypothetical protein